MAVFSHLDVSFSQLFPSGSAADPAGVALAAIATEEQWFEGIDPSTTWAMTWLLEGASWPADVDAPMRQALWRGYRMGRILLGDRPHPSFGRPEITDLFAAAIHILTTELLSGDTLFDVPPQLREATRVASGVMAQSWWVEVRRLEPPAVEAACSILITVGQAVALVEHRLAASREP